MNPIPQEKYITTMVKLGTNQIGPMKRIPKSLLTSGMVLRHLEEGYTYKVIICLYVNTNADTDLEIAKPCKH